MVRRTNGLPKSFVAVYAASRMLLKNRSVVLPLTGNPGDQFALLFQLLVANEVHVCAMALWVSSRAAIMAIVSREERKCWGRFRRTSDSSSWCQTKGHPRPRSGA